MEGADEPNRESASGHQRRFPDDIVRSTSGFGKLAAVRQTDVEGQRRTVSIAIGLKPTTTRLTYI